MRTSELKDISIELLDGDSLALGGLDACVVLVVNVASRCGFSTQYGRLEKMQQIWGSQDFTVLGIPSNQFNQELEEEADIKTYCAITWGVTFPMSKKMVLQGEGQHPLYQALTRIPFANGETGPVRWNFEKFLLLPEGDILRFPHDMNPDSEEIVSLIQSNL